MFSLQFTSLVWHTLCTAIAVTSAPNGTMAERSTCILKVYSGKIELRLALYLAINLEYIFNIVYNLIGLMLYLDIYTLSMLVFQVDHRGQRPQYIISKLHLWQSSLHFMSFLSHFTLQFPWSPSCSPLLMGPRLQHIGGYRGGILGNIHYLYE